MTKISVNKSEAATAQKRIENGKAQLPSSGSRTKLEGTDGDNVAGFFYQKLHAAVLSVDDYRQRF